MLKHNKIIIGTEQLGGTDWGKYNVSNTESAIKYALDFGLRSFDTANVYGLGLSEKRLSNLLGNLRHECEIITKVGFCWNKNIKSHRLDVKKNLSYKSMLSGVEESLKNLKIDRIPVLLAHWPDNIHTTEEVIENLYLLKEKGLINKIGLSNFNLDKIITIQHLTPIDFYQGPLSLLDFSNLDSYRNISRQGVNMLTYGPLHHGMLTGKYNLKSKFPKTDRRHRLIDFIGDHGEKNYTKVDIISKYAEILECDVKALAINMLFTFELDARIILGVKNIEQLNENLNSLELNIPKNIARSLITELSRIN